MRATARFDLEISSSTTPHATDTQVCALKSRAAICPAIAGVGRWTNSSGTTQHPKAVRLPHQSAAAYRDRRAKPMPQTYETPTTS